MRQWVAALRVVAAMPVLAACAAPASPAPEYPHSEAICQYVGLESVEAPQQTDTDSASFAAVYRFRDAHAPKAEAPLSVKFLVNRSRVDELRSHLESQPEVVCTPDNDLHYHVRVKPLPEPPGTGPGLEKKNENQPPAKVPARPGPVLEGY